jgi:hypothetical protein
VDGLVNAMNALRMFIRAQPEYAAQEPRVRLPGDRAPRST